MSEIKSDFVPIDYATSQSVRFDLQLPEYVDRDRIGVNVTAIDGLCRLGGVSHIRVLNDDTDEVSTFEPSIVGFNGQGNAYAAKTGLKTSVPTYSLSSEGEDSDLWDPRDQRPHATRWVNVDLRLNSNEIANRIINNKKYGGVRSVDGWSHYLNDAVKKGLSSAGIKHLTLGINRYNLTWALIQTTDATLFAAGIQPLLLLFHGFRPHIPLPIEFLSYVPSRWFIGNLHDWIRWSKEKGYDYRWSLFEGPQFDRALLLKVLSSRSTLIRSIKDGVTPDV